MKVTKKKVSVVAFARMPDGKMLFKKTKHFHSLIKLTRYARAVADSSSVFYKCNYRPLCRSLNTLLLSSSPRVLRPPGGGSSNIFGGGDNEAAASSKPNKMASNVFAAPEPTESVQKRTNPPGQGQTDTESCVSRLGCEDVLCNRSSPKHCAVHDVCW